MVVESGVGQNAPKCSEMLLPAPNQALEAGERELLFTRIEGRTIVIRRLLALWARLRVKMASGRLKYLGSILLPVEQRE